MWSCHNDSLAVVINSSPAMCDMCDYQVYPGEPEVAEALVKAFTELAIEAIKGGWI